jgi:hypothetical protein
MRASIWDRLRSYAYRLHIPSRWSEVFTLRGWWDAP